MTSRVKHQTIKEIIDVLAFDDSSSKKINPIIWYICGFNNKQKEEFTKNFI